MTFSIVIPTYNGADYVEQSIISAIGQTRPADEIIVSDDNSKDNTLEICYRYADKVKIFKNSLGPSGFVNGWKKAIDHSSCEYISVLHQDDLLKPNFLEEVERALCSNPDVKHIFVPCELIDENNDIIQSASVSNGKVVRYTGIDYVKAYQHIGHPHIHRCPGVVTHRDIFKKCHYRPDAGHIADDDFFYRVGQYTDVLGILIPLAQYRQHGKSETGHLDDIILIQRLIKDYNFQLDHLHENNAFDDESKSYFRNWMLRLIEMELVNAIRSNNENVFLEYLKHCNLLEKYNLRKTRKMIIFECFVHVIGMEITHKFIDRLYGMMNK